MTHRERALVLLHGFMGAAGDWQGVVEAMTSRFDVHALDLPGHGGTPVPEEAFGMESMIDWLNREMTLRQVERFFLVGYSMGGRIALHYALHHPERCVRLVLVSASPGISSEEERRARRAADAVWAEKLERMPARAFLEEWYRQPVFRSLHRREALRKALIEAKSDVDRQAAARVLRALSPGRVPSLWAQLEHLAVPTLALAGALDGKYVDVARRMAVVAPNIRVGIVPDAGHVVHAERENAFLQELGGFVGYLPPALPKPESD